MLATATLLLSGCFSFERASDVVDTRILAISSEPPEVIVGTGALPDVELRALVVDPREPNRITEYEWRACIPDLRGMPFGEGDEDISGTTDDGRCDEDTDSTLISAGDLPLGLFEAELNLPPELSVLALAGSDTGVSVHAQVQLKVDSPEGPLYGRKRVVVSTAVPEDRVANQNPRLTALLLDHTVWEPDEPRRMKLGDCPPYRQAEVVDPEDPTRFQTRCAYSVTPVFDENEAEHYLVQNYSGETVELRERLRFTWFASSGFFSSAQTSQTTNIGPQSHDPISNELYEPGEPGPADFWVVVRDGRGGTSWEHRRIEFVE